jgi:GMP synthase-like glutamine amidotransferase
MRSATLMTDTKNQAGLRIHFIQHVPQEDPASIFLWTARKNIRLTGTQIFMDSRLPDPETLDGLIIMGGSMGVYDQALHPWLIEEKKYIETAIRLGCRILGICLGAQLIADVLGAGIHRNSSKEIGWFPVHLTSAGCDHDGFRQVPRRFMAFHWHSDTFDLPFGAIHLAESEACGHQAFLYNTSVLGLQFHLENTPESIDRLLTHFSEDLSSGPFIQDGDTIRRMTARHHQTAIRLCESFLDAWIG